MLAFRKAAYPDELDEILAFDSSVFSNPGDYMSREDWLECEAYWLIVDDERVGCCALQTNVDYDDTSKPSSLYIASIAIAVASRGRQLGTRFTEWQIEHARERGFSMIVANTRRSNVAMIAVYRKLGFKERAVIDYYDEPRERMIIFDLAL
jgi:ribosomal protein S18 acetylase RimI-like enzyme